MAESYDFAVVGGGAAGFFGAIAFAESSPGSRVVILEKTSSVLGKVKISGGGRCNVTHACFDPKAFTKHYPRGEKTLIGPMHRWSATDTIAWFSGQGVSLKTESDGRMFPVTDDSGTIIECLTRRATDLGIEVSFRCDIESIERDDSGWTLTPKEGGSLRSTAVLVASGGVRNGVGIRLAESVGHSVIPAAPSLFTFKITDKRLADLSGVSVANVTTRIPGTSLKAAGPCLITHWGLSGPAILKLSAWGARELSDRQYQFEVVVNWTGEDRWESVSSQLVQAREEAPKKRVRSGLREFPIPARLWTRLVESVGISEETTWSNLSRNHRQALARNLAESTFRVSGKSMNKDEFVTAGGVSLKEVNFSTLESKLASGLYFAGEVLDIDGITGGFNFQAAWTTGRIAGESAAAGQVGNRATAQ